MSYTPNDSGHGSSNQSNPELNRDEGRPIGSMPSETTLLSPVNTYFSDAKIKIPETSHVSIIKNNILIHCPAVYFHFYNFSARFQFQKAMGFYRARLPDVHSLFGSRKYRKRSTEWNYSRIQAVMGSAKCDNFGPPYAEVVCSTR